MAVSKDQIKEVLGKMPVMELVELISELEEDWGVSAAAPAQPDGTQSVWNSWSARQRLPMPG